MRNLIAAFALLTTVSACNFLKKGEADAGSDAAAVDTSASDAAVVEAAAATPTGKNAAQVARFGSEVALNEQKTIASVTQPRTSPNTGTVVATLHPNTPVTRIATNGPASLIVFADPNVPTDLLMGWVTDAAFSAGFIAVHHDGGVAVVDAGAPATPSTTFACPPGRVGVVLAGKNVCKPPCARDGECKGSRACTLATAVNGGNVKACVNDP